MRKMLLAIALLFSFCALSEESMVASSLEKADEYIRNAGSDIALQDMFLGIVKGEMTFSKEQAIQKIRAILTERLEFAGGFIIHFASLMLFNALVSRLIPGGRHAKSAVTVMNLLMALSMFERTQAFINKAAGALDAVKGIIDAVTPVFVSLLAISGSAHEGAFITPAGAFASGAVTSCLQKAGLMLINVYCALILSKSIGKLTLTKMEEAVRSAVKWLIGSAMSLFLLFVSAGGVIAGAYDGAFQKGLRYAADHLIPIVGSDIAGRMDSISASFALIKSAAGVTGITALFAVCIRPAIDVFLAMWGLRLISAILEAVSGKDCVDLADGFSKALSLLFSLIAASVTMGIVLFGAAIVIGRRFLG